MRNKLLWGSLALLSTVAFAAGTIHWGDLIIKGQLTLSSNTASTVPYLDSNKIVQSSAVTPTELGFVHGVGSSLCGITDSCTLTNKTINGSSNTITNVSLTSGVTGTLPIGNGGTNSTTANGAFNNLSPMTTLGDIEYEDATPKGVRLAGNTTSTKKYLSQTGTGTISAVPAWAQPACGDLSNAATSCSTDATNASNISSGTLGAARLPNPSASTLGGIESLAAVAHNWINTISTSGVPSATQPAFTDISGTAAVNQGGTGQTTYTDGQLLIGNGSNSSLTKATLSAGSNITITNGNGSISIAGSGAAASAYTKTAQTTTYSAVINDWVVASSSSFTITLPDASAAGNSGKGIVIEHNGTTLTQVYTLNTTSAQTINGSNGAIASGTYKLQTAGEILWVLSDGANWQVAAHVTDGPWTSCTFLVIGSTTNPTLATTNTKTCFYKRHSNVMKIYETYTHASATGTVIGSGTYEFTLPGAQTADTTAVVASSTLNLANSLPSSASSLNCGGTTLWSGLATFLFDSTHLAFQEANNTGSLFASTTCGWTNATLQMTIQAEVPISGWQP